MSSFTRPGLAAVFFLSIFLAACGGGGGGTSTAPPDPSDGGSTTTTVSGKAEAPGGTIAQFDRQRPFLLAALDFLMPPSQAAITGLQPVTGATVQLIRIDDDGNQVGDVLASTVTSLTGDYSLSLPAGVSLAGNLVVRISGNNASMSAMVVDQAVNINPVSQFILNKFVNDPGLVLADLRVNEVVALRGKVEDFDLTAEADLSGMLAKLEQELGEFVESEVEVIDADEDDGSKTSLAAGNWNVLEFNIGFHDSETANSFGVFSSDVYGETIAITSTGTGTLEINTGTSLLLDTFTNYSTQGGGTTNLFHETSIEPDAATFSATITADGRVTATFPFEEELQTVDTQNDLDGPDFGWRWPPGSLLIEPGDDGALMVNTTIDAGVRYATVDTDNDGIKDAIDPGQKDGDEISAGMLLLLKQGSGMTKSSLQGDFGFVGINVDMQTTPQLVASGWVGKIGIDGTNVNEAIDAFDVFEVTRTPGSFPAVSLTAVSSSEPAIPDSYNYTVSDAGLVALDFNNDGTDVLEGYSNADGSIIGFVGSTANGSPTVTSVSNEMGIALKLGSGVSTTAIQGATFRLHSVQFGMAASGVSEISRLKNGELVFDANGTNAVLSGTVRGIGRPNDIGAIDSLTPLDISLDMSVTIGSDGRVQLSLSDGTLAYQLHGYLSADGETLALVYLQKDSASQTREEVMGLVIGTRR
jgi:hypothetical protein